MAEQQLSRRSFLAGLGVAGAAVAGAGLAACAPQTGGSEGGSAADAGTGSGAAAAGTNPAADNNLVWLPAEPADPTDIELEETVDVVVVGTGVAGTAAVRAAAEAGAKVVAIEKGESAGVSRSGEYAILGGQMMANWGRGDGFLDQDECVDHEMDEMCYYPKREIYSKWAKGCGAVFDWWCAAKPDLYIHMNGNEPIPDEYNVNDDEHCTLYAWFAPMPANFSEDFYKSEKHPTFPSSITFYPSQKNIVKANIKKAEEAGATIYTGHFAEKLIMEGDRVTGVFVRNAETGQYKKLTASKGVVLATGDYSSNDDIMRYYCPEVYQNNVPKMFPDVDVEGNLANDGSGLKMGAWIGADIQQRHAPMIHYMGDMTGHDGTTGIGTSPFLRLSIYGKRFMDEDVPGQQVQNALETVPGKKCWTIWDSKWAEQVPFFQPMHGSVNYVVDKLPTDPWLKDGVNPYITFDACDKNAEMEGATLIKADSIDELLDKMTSLVDKEAAKASIERYNQFAINGKDEDFNKRPDRLFPVESGPFYAFESGMSMMLVCCGGLVSDEDCHVYDKEGKIIKGLYVAGNIQGDRYAVAYPIAFKGVSHSLCMYYGKVAGDNAAAEA